MKLTLIVGVLLSLASLLLKAEDYQVPELPYSYFPKEDEFNLSLMRNDDPAMQAIGLNYWTYQYDTDKHEPEVRHLMLKTLKRLMNHPKPPADAFHEMYSICEHKDPIIQCPIDRVIAKHMDLYPLDGTAYLLPLEQAVKDDNEGEVIHWVKKMAKANSFIINMHYPSSFYSLIDQHIESNPHSKEAFDYFLNDYLSTYFSRTAPTESELASIQNHMLDFVRVNGIYMMGMLKSMPSLRPLLQACEQFPELKSECLKIAEMMHSSPSLLGQFVSLAMAEKAYQTSGQVEKAADAEAKKLRFKKLYECMMNYDYVLRVESGTYRFLEEALLVSVEKGELAGIQRHSELNYQAALKAGHEGAEQLNPELCYEGIEDGYFESVFSETM